MRLVVNLLKNISFFLEKRRKVILHFNNSFNQFKKALLNYSGNANPQALFVKSLFLW